VSAGLRVCEHDGGRGHRPAARLRGGVVVTTIGVTAGQKDGGGASISVLIDRKPSVMYADDMRGGVCGDVDDGTASAEIPDQV
jgi:hypothetical protein